jgi:hypothetical protein
MKPSIALKPVGLRISCFVIIAVNMSTCFFGQLSGYRDYSVEEEALDRMSYGRCSLFFEVLIQLLRSSFCTDSRWQARLLANEQFSQTRCARSFVGRELRPLHVGAQHALVTCLTRFELPVVGR